MANSLIDTKDASKLLDVSPRQARKLAADGKVKVEKIGNAWAFDIDDLKRYRTSKH